MKTITALFCAFIFTALSPASGQTFQHFEARHVHPIGLTPDGTKLLALNTRMQASLQVTAMLSQLSLTKYI